MKATCLPDDPVALKAIIVGLQRTIEEQEAANTNYAAILADKETTIAEMAQQITLFKILLHASKSEKAKRSSAEVQYTLFDEAELMAPQQDDEQPAEPECTVAAHQRKKRGRRPLPADIPRVDVVIDIPEEDKVCACGCTMSRIGEEVSEKLDVVPAKFQVTRYIRPKWACTKGCKGADDLDPGIKYAPMPPQLIPQGIVTPGLLAWILVSKFVDGLPFYRQTNIFRRLGVDVSRATMSNWAILAARACEPLMERLYARLRAGPCINLDETPLQVLNEPGRKNTSRSYMWVARGGPKERPVVLFRYAPTRSGEIARSIVGGFKGFLQTDGYAGYNAIGESKGIVHVGCLVHVRRKFMDVLKTGGKKSGKSGIAQTVVELIAKIYKLEKKAGEDELEPPEIHAMRQEHIRPLLDKIKILLEKHEKAVPPKSLLGVAIHYALGQWSRIEAYLEDGRLRPDNNLIENAIRPFALGRKNWLFSGSPRGAKSSACLYSLIETAKACGMSPFQYLLELFEKLPHAKSEKELDTLLPQRREE